MYRRTDSKYHMRHHVNEEKSSATAVRKAQAQNVISAEEIAYRQQLDEAFSRYFFARNEAKVNGTPAPKPEDFTSHLKRQ